MFQHEPPELRARSKVKKKTYLEVGSAKIVEQLRFVVIVKRACAFQFDNDLAIHHKVSPKQANRLVPKRHGYCFFALDLQAFIAQGYDHGFPINRFKETLSQLTVDLVKAREG